MVELYNPFEQYAPQNVNLFQVGMKMQKYLKPPRGKIGKIDWANREASFTFFYEGRQVRGRYHEIQHPENGDKYESTLKHSQTNQRHGTSDQLHLFSCK